VAETDVFWSARDTEPGAIEAALRNLEARLYAESPGAVPARALNLVCVVDAAYAGEIANRLAQVGRYHASRTVVCSVQPGRETLDARVTVTSEADAAPGRLASIRETVMVTVGERHLPALHTIVDPLVITDVATVAWAPHGHPEAVDVLTGVNAPGMEIAQVVLLDSLDDPAAGRALQRVDDVAGRVYVVDLSWLRCTPWRERLAAAFDPPPRRSQLRAVAKVSVRHRTDSTAAGLLLLGWLCARLGWRPAALTSDGRLLRGRARGRRGEVELRLEPVDDMDVPGLAGVEVSTDDGWQLALERGAGGLVARRREGRPQAPPVERTWTVLGASRGEGGILGEGIRQALLRDPTHRPALDAAARLAA
jgi:glucose-6-phosphate dehydrogenase assembly protein OpcA